MGPRRGSIHAKLQGLVMTIEVAIQPLAALVAGFLILLAPRLLSYVVCESQAIPRQKSDPEPPSGAGQARHYQT